jgi:hypothetical protein
MGLTEMQTEFWRETHCKAATGRTEKEMGDMITMDHQEVGSARGEVGGSDSGLCPGELN